MLRQLLCKCYSDAVTLADTIISSRWWEVKVIILVLVVGLFFAFPSYDVFWEGRYQQSWEPVILKIRDPFFDMTTIYDIESHAAKLNFRILIPIIAHLLGCGIVGCIILAYLGGLCLIWLLLRLGLYITNDKITAVFLAFLLIGTFAGVTSFVEFRGIFDGISLVLILGSMVYQHPLIVFLLLFLACWNDERTLISAGFVFIFYAYLNAKHNDKLHIQHFRSFHSLAVILAIVAYLGIRLCISRLFALPTVLGRAGLPTLLDQINNLPMGAWTGFECGWLLIIISFFVLIAKRQWLALLSFSGMVGITILGSIAVVDITRSMAYGLPAIFIALLILVREIPIAELRKQVFLVAMGSLVCPTYYAGGQKSIWWQYPFPIQAIRWVLLFLNHV